MLYIYLDESGDMGFNLKNDKTTTHFVVSILLIKGELDNRFFINAVKKTLRRKLNPKNKRKRIVTELKGTKLNSEVKKYFYSLVKNLEFEIYSIVVNKSSFKQTRDNQSRFYNYISRRVLNGIQFNEANTSINLIIDKSKKRPGILQFNRYIKNSLEGKIKPSVPFNIYHMESHKSHGLQAIDLFCHGIFEKYERGLDGWYSVFDTHIKKLSVLPE